MDTIGHKKRRLEFIDALRALAILSVFAIHARAYWVAPSPIAHASVAFIIDRIAAQGTAGVDLFIVLSGFCMTYPLVRGGGGRVANISALRFYKRRAVRLLPAYYLALALVVGMLQVHRLQTALVGHPINLTDVVTYVLFVQQYNAHTIGAINGPMWTISLEMTLYLVFPVLLTVLRRWGWATLGGGAIALGLLWFTLAAVLSHAAPGNPWVAEMSDWLPAHLFEFVLGMGSAYLISNPVPQQFRLAVLALPVAAVVGAVGTIENSNLTRIFGWGFAAVSLTLVAATLSDRSRIRRVIALAAPLGIVSYSFYLLHQPFLLLTAGAVHSFGTGVLVEYVILTPAGVGAMAAIAWLFFRGAERPFLLAGSMRDAILSDDGFEAARGPVERWLARSRGSARSLS